MSTVQAIVHATTTLSRIQGVDRETLLLTHRKELESAFHNLQALLQPIVPPASSSSPDVPTATCTSPNASDIPRETSAPRDILSASAIHGALETAQVAGDTHKEDNNSIPRQVETLLKSLNKRESEILEYQPAQSALFSGTVLASEDPRVVQISLMDRTTLDKKFQAGLSALSLADEYTEWEGQFRTTRVGTLLGGLTSASNRKDTYYGEYVGISDHFKDKGRAQKYIEYGVKFRVFEAIYLAHAEVNTGDTKPGTHYGVLGILFFIFYEFLRLKYDYMPMLANAILSSQWRDHAEGFCQSVVYCFEGHKGQSSNYQAQEQVLASNGTRKRRRLERITNPSHVTSQSTPRAQFPDLVPLEHTQALSSQDPFGLQTTATVLGNSQHALPDLVPLEHTQALSSQDPFGLQTTATVLGNSQHALPDLVPLEHTQALSSQDPFGLQTTATVLGNSQHTLPDPVPLEQSQGVSFGNPSLLQDTPIPDLYPIELGLTQDIEAEMRNIVSNLDPRSVET